MVRLSTLNIQVTKTVCFFPESFGQSYPEVCAVFIFIINWPSQEKIKEYDQEIPQSHTADQPMAS